LGGVFLAGENKEKDEAQKDSYVNKLVTRDAEFTIHMKKLKNPVYILEQLYLLRQNGKLSDEKKNEEVKKIMADYLR